MFWRKKVDKIEHMKVSCKSYFENNNHAYTFAIHLERTFTENAKLALKPVIEDFLILASGRSCKECYWFVYAYDFYEYWLYEQYESYEMSNYLIENNPDFTYVYIYDFHILFLLNELTAQTFSTFKDATFLNGDALGLDVFDAGFMAFHASDIYSIISRISKECGDFNEVVNILRNQKKEIDVWYIDSYGAKVHLITFTCPVNKKDAVKDCMIEVFSKHDIKLDFIDEDIL